MFCTCEGGEFVSDTDLVEFIYTLEGGSISNSIDMTPGC